RDIHAAAAAGDARAAAALDVYHHRLRHYLGAYLAQLGGADAIVFTGGLGENAAATRAAVVSGMAGLGILIDPARNEARADGARAISDPSSPVAVLIVPTDEELEIARHQCQHEHGRDEPQEVRADQDVADDEASEGDEHPGRRAEVEPQRAAGQQGRADAQQHYPEPRDEAAPGREDDPEPVHEYHWQRGGVDTRMPDVFWQEGGSKEQEVDPDPEGEDAERGRESAA
ncbi:MAG: hypothetical protein V7768_09235, partial [Dietzia cercidiphylli]